MTPFISVSGIAAPLMLENIDTDAIIPSREMKRVSKVGLAEGLFAGWRYITPDTRDPDPDFILNHPPFDNACILIAGHNFGCGSSREYAVWALREWGIRAIIAPGFGSIFRNNCVRNGLLPVVLDEDVVERLARAVFANPFGASVTIDLQSEIVSQGNAEWPFDIAAAERQILLEGLDFIDITLKHIAKIEEFEAHDRQARSWAYP